MNIDDDMEINSDVEIEKHSVDKKVLKIERNIKKHRTSLEKNFDRELRKSFKKKLENSLLEEEDNDSINPDRTKAEIIDDLYPLLLAKDSSTKKTHLRRMKKSELLKSLASEMENEILELKLENNPVDSRDKGSVLLLINESLLNILDKLSDKTQDLTGMRYRFKKIDDDKRDRLIRLYSKIYLKHEVLLQKFVSPWFGIMMLNLQIISPNVSFVKKK